MGYIYIEFFFNIINMNIHKKNQSNKTSGHNSLITISLILISIPSAIPSYNATSS